MVLVVKNPPANAEDIKTPVFNPWWWVCHIFTWISHGYTCVPILNPLLHPSHPTPLGLSQFTGFECPVSCMELALVIYFTYGNTNVSILFSKIIPPSPFPTESKSLFFISVCLLVSRIKGCHYHLLKFHVCRLIYCVGVFLSDLLHSV